MHRIDTKTAQKDKFGAGKNGFTRGNPQTGTPATDLDDDYFDMLQEELCSVVEASGASLEKGRHDQLLTALRALLLSRKNPFGDIKLDGTVQKALENLGLGEAAKRDVGTTANQIPGMESFTHTIIDSKTHVFTFPNGMMLQTGSYTAPEYTGTLTFPVPFPTRLLAIAGINFNSTLGTPSVISSYAMFFADSGSTKISISSTLTSKALSYIAVGV